MKEIIINGKNIIDRASFHRYMKEGLNLGDYYGENLDALWDILSPYSEQVLIRIINQNLLEENLGQYGKSIVDLFLDLEEENYNIVLIKEES